MNSAPKSEDKGEDKELREEPVKSQTLKQGYEWGRVGLLRREALGVQSHKT